MGLIWIFFRMVSLWLWVVVAGCDGVELWVVVGY